MVAKLTPPHSAESTTFHIICFAPNATTPPQCTAFGFKTVQPHIGLRFQFNTNWYTIERVEVQFASSGLERRVEWFAVADLPDWK